MKFLNRSFVAAVLSALFATAPAASQAELVVKEVPTYTVFLDLPTGFVFVKLPVGWKFVGNVETKDVTQVPAGVVTDLLAGDDDDKETSRLASQQRK